MNHKSLSIYHCRLVGRVLMWHAFSRRWVWVRLPSNIVKNHHQASLKFGFLKTSWYKSTTEKHSHGALTWIPSSSSRDSSLAIGASSADAADALACAIAHAHAALRTSLRIFSPRALPALTVFGNLNQNKKSLRCASFCQSAGLLSVRNDD